MRNREFFSFPRCFVSMVRFLFLGLCFFFSLCSGVKADGQELEFRQDKNFVPIYFFHSNSCSHCQREMELLDSLEKDYSNIMVYRYEVHEEENQEIWEQVKNLYQLKTESVPLTVIGDTFYLGYSEEKSRVQFIKTVEYYSRYGYVDRVGQLLKIEEVPIFKIQESDPTLDEFVESYGNYSLIGSISTNDLDISIVPYLLGILSQVNLIHLGFLVIVLLFLTKIFCSKDQILLFLFYLGISFFFGFTYVIDNSIFSLIVEIFLLILFMKGLLGYFRNRKRQYLYGNVFLILAVVSTYLEKRFFPYYGVIFKKLLILHSFSGLEKINFYFSYLFGVLMIQIILLLLFLGIRNLKKFIRKKLG